MLVVKCAALMLVGVTPLVPAPAGAVGQERQVVVRFQAPFEDTIDCADFGPYDFDDVFSGWQRLSITEVYAGDGTLEQVVLSSTYREMDRNATTGSTLSLRGSYTQTLDFTSGTMTLTGNVGSGRLADGTSLVREIGRLVLSLETREPTFVAGPHEALELGGVSAAVCAALV